MWVYQSVASSIYKRTPSRDNPSSTDMEASSGYVPDNSGLLTTDPPWKHSLPHVLVATITSFLFGYHLGVVNEPLESISLDLGFSGNTLAEGLVVSTCLGGAFIGSLFSGWIADGFGRCKAFQLSALPMIIGASMSALSKTLLGMLLGRFLVGIGMGVGSPVASLYVTEVSPAYVRGTYGSFIQISTCLGLMTALLVFIGSTLLGLQQLSGINAIFYFSSTVFKNVGVPSNLANIAIGTFNLAGSIVAMVLMDRLGRKILLLGSFLGMAICTAIQAVAASHSVTATGAIYLSVGGMLLFVFTFALGAGPVPGLLLPEIFPSRIRAKAMAVCMSVHWVINFFVGLLFLRLLEQLGPRLLYSMFTTFCLMAVIFVKRNVIETKGKSLQEIEIALLPQD
ncbi:hypothetical protein SAY87_029179 [Trapa incisa]|uniref:Major facilitator superfamily (MFS) profile domain-containing protein n=1 Tax=Trapa incisa TaxID=236973 RepID=A0AAN7L3B0_9MYRT|nr:hypothetical protein SAY87_029179 [Trapa incisa]